MADQTVARTETSFDRFQRAALACLCTLIAFVGNVPSASAQSMPHATPVPDSYWNSLIDTTEATENMASPDTAHSDPSTRPSQIVEESPVDSMEARALESNHELNGQGPRHFLSSFRLPDKLVFAGEEVPLDNWQMRERIEFEFYQFLEDEGENIIIAKRTGRCFPPVEQKLAEAGMPDDLKYMLLVESKCVASAYSRARASGPWQFMRSTGKRYKLRSNKWRDERRNLELSTDAAIKYLRFLEDKFGDWFLAMAAYNAGEVKIQRLLKKQKVNDYWKLHSVRETMRYVPRIIAAKEIFSQPEVYLGLTREELYTPVETETVTVRVKKSRRSLASIAKEFDTYYLELKMLNPELKRGYLPRGTHRLRIPKRGCPDRCLEQAKTP
ncbi:MAG: lytic transglycosylase domain-containing protein [Nitrospiraceae bacterium]